MDKAQHLVGDHADLINDDSVNVPPVSLQVVESLSAQLMVPGAVTVFHRQVQGPVNGQAADVEGGHTCRSYISACNTPALRCVGMFSDHTDDVTLSSSQ